MSSQKWLPVAITENHTQSGHISHRAFAHLARTIRNRPTPMISESAACRLGIAAYGLASARTIALSWLIPKLVSVSTKPSSGNILGGAVGISTYPTSPITFASSSVLRSGTKRSFRRR